MRKNIDKILLKIFPKIPCLSPNRYQGCFLLKEILETFLKEDKKYQILDAGCGTGIYAEFLKVFGIKGSYLGVDLEFKQDVSPFKETKDFKIKFQRANLNKFNLKKKFDLILCLWTLEHLKDDSSVLKSLKTHLKKEGMLVLAIPSFWSWPFDYGRHGFHYYSLKKVKKLLEKSGLKVLKFQRCGGLLGWLFVLFYSWLSLLVLAPILGVYKFLGKLPKKKTRQDLGTAFLSRKILNNTVFVYKKTKWGRKMHYNLVKIIVRIDNKLPFFESSYFLVLKQKDGKD